MKNKLMIAALLINAGADYNVVDNINMSPFDCLTQLSFEQQCFLFSELKKRNGDKENKIIINLQKKLLNYHYSMILLNKTKSITSTQFAKLIVDFDLDDFVKIKVLDDSSEINQTTPKRLISFLSNNPSKINFEINKAAVNQLKLDEEKQKLTPHDHQLIEIDRKLLMTLLKMFNDKIVHFTNNPHYTQSNRIKFIIVFVLVLIISSGIDPFLIYQLNHSCDNETNNGIFHSEDPCYQEEEKWANLSAVTIFMEIVVMIVLGTLAWCWSKSPGNIKQDEWQDLLDELNNYMDNMREDESLPSTHNQIVTELTKQIITLHDNQPETEVINACMKIFIVLSEMQKELNSGKYRKGITLFKSKNQINPDPLVIQVKNENNIPLSYQSYNNDNDNDNDNKYSVQPRDDSEESPLLNSRSLNNM